ncbi:hypothetical protein Mp_3g18150 [Marchantia polymorpha subsp. ruderalis]|uniref:Chromo domain-containing protein n=2 Tax=Marchantia polymorpha TaxID=3197 RepID=A0AAF6B239_MARPO|nr:hypothetical protein MARPO_0140s0026 [Marchantia polymorpha]BBN06073.1 hypothetical protein Mp_3g18150 [Marchantia polymorpha subsp. ruderalis]|eukprot:PTQ29494.1 hypothetical protein MARPO_0140s0026 [Marchantia polymorpha]
MTQLVGLVACPLELSPLFKIHQIFHVSLLESYHETKFEVQQVFNTKKLRGKPKYLVFWQVYSLLEAIWEPIGNLIHIQDLVNQFFLTLLRHLEYVP